MFIFIPPINQDHISIHHHMALPSTYSGVFSLHSVIDVVCGATTQHEHLSKVAGDAGRYIQARY